MRQFGGSTKTDNWQKSDVMKKRTPTSENGAKREGVWRLRFSGAKST